MDIVLYLLFAAKLADRGKEEISNHDDSSDSNMDGWQVHTAPSVFKF